MPNNNNLVKLASKAILTHSNEDLYVILDTGIDLETLHNGNTLLFIACVCSNESAVTELLQRGAKINTKSTGGETAIFAASASLNINILETILNAGGKPNDQNDEGLSPLSATIETYEEVDEDEDEDDVEMLLAIVQLLLSKGANPYLKDYSGRTPVTRANEMDNLVILDALVNNTSPGRSVTR